MEQYLREGKLLIETHENPLKYVHTHLLIYIYIYIEREREIDR